MTRNPCEFARNCRQSPSLLSICAEVSRLVDEPNTSVDEITAVIGKDSGLAARVLRLVNSVVYGCVGHIGSLERAVQLVGLNQVRELVISSSIIHEFENVSSELMNVDGFWRHNYTCATAAMLLAKKFNLAEPEHLFVGGLLHDIGRLFMVLEAPEQAQRVFELGREKPELSSSAERHVLGFDHAALGAELLTLWQCPRSLANIVRSHHNPVQVGAHQLEVFVVHYADFITSVLDGGESGEFLVAPLVVPRDLRAYVLEDQSLEQLIEELDTCCNGAAVAC